ncbi:hypothetical protein [Microbacterium sp. NPDC056052]|uniref:hypothetical protein n=1 Tax=Microbacterium sp. NPDC056052 TaxID=3345695 RepID=UPI0035E282D9
MSRERIDGAGIPRRRILKGAAWSVPVIAAVAAVPAHAASTGTPSAHTTVHVDTFAQNGVQSSWSPEAKANLFVTMTGSADFRVDWSAASPVTSAVLVIDVPLAGLDTTTVPTVTGTGWSFAGVVVSADVAHYAFAFAGAVGPDQTSSRLQYVLPGDQVTPVAAAFSKTVSGTLSGTQFDQVVTQVTWYA